MVESVSQEKNSATGHRRTMKYAFGIVGLCLLALTLSSISYNSETNKLARRNLMGLIDDKRINLNNIPNAVEQGLAHIGFIHIGKCGGVSVNKAILGPKYNAILARGVRTYHMEKPPDSAIQRLKDWIIAVRDPIERVQSNWVYSHPDNNHLRRDHSIKGQWQQRLYECYSTLDEAATIGLTSASQDQAKLGDDFCPSLLRHVLLGNIEDGQLLHFRRGFRWHLTPLLKNNIIEEKNIYVIRTENMSMDLNSISRAMGGREVFGDIPNYPHFVDPETNTVPKELPYGMANRNLSPQGMANLCWLLCDEIQIYKQVVGLAQNLKWHGDQAHKSIQRLAQHCPKEAADDYDCPLYDHIANGAAFMKEGIPKDIPLVKEIA
mmetsp:Transcript_14838/g.22665  ORF Transcript_14838/g.22665 Transcript_14838/m.22665 type:complete len:378 (+) Transcript_14838:118-1251(+)